MQLSAWALTEEISASDATCLGTRAFNTGNVWNLNGSKNFITHGSVASVIVVLASTVSDAKQRGITAFLIESDMPGFTCSQPLLKIGMRASNTVKLFFRDVEVPLKNQLGQLNKGMADTLYILDRGRIGIAALAVGIARSALEKSLSYARERKQFGKFIADFQATQFKFADMATQIDAARLLVMRAASLADEYLQTGKSFTKEASMAKLFASEIAVRAAEEAIQIHGGFGYLRTNLVGRKLCDAKLLTIGEGTSEIQRLVIARQLLTGDI